MAVRPPLKQFGDLTLADFEKSPVWIGCHGLDSDEDWYDETDEETFRPWNGLLPVDPSEGMLLVRAKFTLADKSVFDGFCTPEFESDPPHLGTSQPQILIGSGRPLSFWSGSFEPKPDVMKSTYTALGKTAGKVFPFQFEAVPGLTSGRCSGTVEGFTWVREVKHGLIFKKSVSEFAFKR